MITNAISSYMTEQPALPFCPGCGHDRLLKELDKALVKLQLDPHKTVIVTDIGCIGLSDQYYVTNAFHGLHGRSLTYATGIKLARPELTVIVLMGDGGCGIGGAHLLNAARRNLDLTLIIANNFNYGMTGGQSSVSTPLSGRTATMPGGGIEPPMDLCAISAAAGASWVYRGMTHDIDLADSIAQAIRHNGFSVLDIWELCTAYYTPRNAMNKRELMELAATAGMQTGLLQETQRPEFGAAYRAASVGGKQLRRIPVEKKFANNLTRQMGIVIAGGAGQKVKSAATAFAYAGMLCGLDVTQKDDYPITVMTGHSLSEVNFSPAPIEYTAIDDPDYFLVLSEEGLKKSRKWIGRLAPTCTLFADDQLALPETKAKIRRLDLARARKEIGKLSLSIAATAALVIDSAFIPFDALLEAIRLCQPPDIAEGSLKAAGFGAKLSA